MALLPMGQTTEHPSATQESMFEEPTGFSGSDPEEMAYYASDDASEDASVESSFEAAEDFPAEALETASSEPTHEPQPSPAVTSSAVEPAEPTAQPTTTIEADVQPLTVLSVDDFAALEERVFRAVNLVRSERLARAAAEERAAALDAQIHAQQPTFERLQQEVEALRIEREQVRQRVERLLSQLDALEL